MVRSVAILLAVAALVTSCGQLGDQTGDELEATCGSLAFETIPADWSGLPRLGDTEDEIDFAAVEEERYFFDEYDWYVMEEGRRMLHLFGVARDPGLAEGPSGLGYAGAELERVDGSWVPRSWGQCRIEITANGSGNANFVLDPGVEPDPASTTVAVLAWERECASGQAPEGRDVEAAVLDSDADSISIVMLVEPVRSGAECPGNPSFPFEVDLGEPLGDRAVLDASFDPPVERPWPPTQTSLDSTGYDE